MQMQIPILLRVLGQSTWVRSKGCTISIFEGVSFNQVLMGSQTLNVNAISSFAMAARSVVPIRVCSMRSLDSISRPRLMLFYVRHRADGRKSRVYPSSCFTLHSLGDVVCSCSDIEYAPSLHRQSDARTSAEFLSTHHPTFMNSMKSLQERSEPMLDALAVLRGK